MVDEEKREFYEWYKAYLKEDAEKHDKYDYSSGRYWENGHLRFRVPSPFDEDAFREYTKNKIYTIPYYGSKRNWQEEFKLLFTYAKQSYGCNSYIDCFGGSGILALWASKIGYERVQLNDMDYDIVNYHQVMKDNDAFKKFIYYIDSIHHCQGRKMDNDELISIIERKRENYVKELKKRKGSRTQIDRKQWKKISVMEAVDFYLIKHYAFSGQGTIVKERKPAIEYIKALKKTHELYKDITITQYFYKKVMIKNLDDKSALIVLDCPYLETTRVQKKSYNVEMTERQHRYMLEELTKQNVMAKVVVCGYDNHLYNNYFLRCNKNHCTSWHCIKLLRAGSKKAGVEAKERLWINFDIDSLVSENRELFELLY